MWILLAIGSAFFAGITAILSKCGIKNIDSDVAMAIRTIVVLVFSWLMVFIVGSASELSTITFKTWVFLILSAVSTGVSWLFYFRAIQLGNINKVAPIDKFSTVLTIILAFILLGETITWLKFAAVILIGVGTFLMIERKDISGVEPSSKKWFIYAVLSMVFASLTAIFGKVGIEGVESNLGTAIRTCVVLVMAWMIVFLKHKQSDIKKITPKDLMFIVLSGIATGASWLCYWSALRDGLASVVVPIDKLSILITIVFSYFVFGEKLNVRTGFGLLLIVAGTLLMVVA